MSTSLTIGVTTYSIQAAKPSTAYGQLAQVPLRWGAAQAMMRAALTKIPANATVVSATLRVWPAVNVNGTFTLRAYANTGAWPSAITWSKRPATTQVASVDVTNPRTTTGISLNVTAAVQQVVARQRVDRGWQVAIAQDNLTLKVRGSTAPSYRPTLYVTYTVPPATPTGLEPSDAAVADSQPTLLFDADAAITALQVQVDPAANAAAPAFDSGTVAATGGMLDLAETAYAGLDDGATTYWRARQQTDGGWSPWSTWVAFSRVAHSALTITSPSGETDADGNTVVADGTPPVTWTFGGTQVAWRARLLAANGDVIADSGRHAGTDTDWTPATGLTVNGQTGIVEVDVWDDTDRTATPGAPAEVIAELPVVLVPDATIEPFADQAVTADWFEPLVTVTGTRSAIPDQVALLRDGAEVQRWAGVDVCQPGASGFVCTVTDPTAVMGRPQTWHLVPVVNAKKGPAGVGATMIPTCQGIWLTATDDTSQRVALFGNDDQAQDQPETSIVHQPLGDNLVIPVVRRRLLRSSPQGSVTGTIVDTIKTQALDHEARLRAWVADDAGTLYWLTLGGYTGQVIIGDVVFTEVNHAATDGRVLNVSLNWWEQNG